MKVKFYNEKKFNFRFNWKKKCFKRKAGRNVCAWRASQRALTLFPNFFNSILCLNYINSTLSSCKNAKKKIGFLSVVLEFWSRKPNLLDYYYYILIIHNWLLCMSFMLLFCLFLIFTVIFICCLNCFPFSFFYLAFSFDFIHFLFFFRNL